MAGLIDIAPLVASVDVRGNQVSVHGLEADTIGKLLWDYPEVRKMWETRSFDKGALLKLSKDAAATIIASCVEEISQESAANLALGERVEILAKIIKISMPRGFGPFVELMEALGVTSAVPSDTAPGTKSQKPSKA